MANDTERFMLYDVQANGDKVLVGTFDTFEDAQAANVGIQTASIERVTLVGTTVLFQSPRETK
jgi:hypothetical protein